MIYTERDGSPRSGVVWSPGPLPNTVWVLPYSGAGTAVVVKLDRKAGTAVRVEAPSTEHPGHRSYNGRIIPPSPVDRQAYYLRKYAHAAPLPNTVWTWALSHDAPALFDEMGAAA